MLVTLESDWKELCTPEAWEKWLVLARKHDKLFHEIWTDTSGCEECWYLNKDKAWCNYQELPATYNPVMSMFGMACMGMVPKVQQGELFR